MPKLLHIIYMNGKEQVVPTHDTFVLPAFYARPGVQTMDVGFHTFQVGYGGADQLQLRIDQILSLYLTTE
jgi:hypothetical protein